MNSTAVLSRTNRGLASVEQALSAADIPFHYINRSGFFAQSEIQSCLAYLGACLFPANYIISGMLRSDFHPTKFLPRTKIASKFKELKESDKDISYWTLITKEPRTLVELKNLEALQHFSQFVHSLSRYRDLSASEALKSVLGALKVGEHFAGQDSIDNDPVGNLVELTKLAAKHSTIKEFLDYTRRASAASKGRKGVALGTVHSAKGLQWQDVYVIGCQEGMMPHAKSDDLEGERNCFFVACSRAERRLVISWSGQPSPFLKKESE